MPNKLDLAVLEAEVGQIEMRAARRSPILQRCFVHPTTAPAAQAWQCVAYNISELGIGVALPIKLAEGTTLNIEAWNLPRACPLRVRVIQARLVDFVWFTGCEMTRRLSEAELQVWCSGPLDWADGPLQ